MKGKEQTREAARSNQTPPDLQRASHHAMAREHPFLQLQRFVGNQTTLRLMRDSTPARHEDFRGAATNPFVEGSEPRVEHPDRSFPEISSPAPITLSRL